VNKDLADVLGNLVSRVTKFALSKFGDTIPAGGTLGARETALIADITQKMRAYEGFMEAMEVRKAATELRGLWVAGNEYLQAAAPWTVVKTDPEQAAVIIRLAMNLIRLYAIIARPFIPDASAAMMQAVRSTDWTWPEDVAQCLDALPAGHAFAVPENLFRKITDEERVDWQQRFAGIRT
jgi:methionyl-tRNA synthetase